MLFSAASPENGFDLVGVWPGASHGDRLSFRRSSDRACVCRPRCPIQRVLLIASPKVREWSDAAEQSATLGGTGSQYRTELLLYEDWEDVYSVFCLLTGETHQLNELPAEILRRLGESPCTISRLAEEFSAECDVENSPDWQQKIEAIVQDLHHLELIDKVRERHP